ncbi:hypothetical protein A3J89_01175 [Candidatus Curtissbacteria bacterium RIFOXYB12_FULL_40_6]|nr:MAG: hypothetical protein A3J89_01175 [Candidatus Curtissbacteria bacterium RIFOXYB12_FULL_40_6]
MAKNSKNIKRTLLLAIILILSSISFFSALSKVGLPYTSDTLFYKHIFYQFQGGSFNEARDKVLKNHQILWPDKIQRNIFSSEETYKNSYTFFTKRPLYPFMAFIINKFIRNEFYAFMLPVFISFLGFITLAFFLLIKRTGVVGASIGCLLLVSTPLFIKNAIYFMTDTIGAFFWLTQIILIIAFLQKPKWQVLLLFTICLIISLFNREQSLFIVPTIIIAGLFFLKQKESTQVKRIVPLLLLSSTISLLYILGLYLLGQRGALDSIVYAQNSFGFYNNSFTKIETVAFMIDSISYVHQKFIKDLLSSPAYTLFFTTFIFAVFRFFKQKNGFKTIDTLILSSGIGSYLSIFILPLLNYRYFFPVMFTVIYFSTMYILEFLKSLEQKPPNKTEI